MSNGDTFPRQYARTRRLTLGDPRDVRMSPDGATVLFLRSRSGTDPLTCLWAIDTASGHERLVVDPTSLGTSTEQMTDAERARRERLRESAEGITSFDCDRSMQRAVFTADGRAVVCELASGQCTVIDIEGSVFDPRLSPDGQRCAMVRHGRLLVVDVAPETIASGAAPPVLLDLGEDHADVTWGMAEFIAAEEMGRTRGHWWTHDGSSLLACRVDNAPVSEWDLTDPATPWKPARTMRYPAAGTDNALVGLYLVAADGSSVIPIRWDSQAFPYLARVGADEYGPLLAVQSRDQRQFVVLRADEAGATRVVHHDRDEHWVELVPGCPAGVDADTIITCVDRDGARRLDVAGTLVTPADVQVRSVLAASASGVLFTANPIDDATVLHLWKWTPSDGAMPLAQPDGIVAAAGTHDHHVIRISTLDRDDANWTLPNGTSIASLSHTPLVDPKVHLVRGVGAAGQQLDVAILLPTTPAQGPLPVLLDPYGGPHALRVVRSSRAFASSQWFADQGFIVIVCDGRGTPGRGSTWERTMAGDLASAALEDQIAALDIAEGHLTETGIATMDRSRVGIRGWSFGGYLAALAVIRRPDAVHAAVAGAPVTEWRWYDTHYTERYLGNPQDDEMAYDRSSLLPEAHQLTRPLLLIHGLADDNVVAAHTLQLSSALLAAGRPHEVLPLVGVSHMTPQEVIAENLLVHQLEFLRRSLSVSATLG